MCIGARLSDYLNPSVWECMSMKVCVCVHVICIYVNVYEHVFECVNEYV